MPDTTPILQLPYILPAQAQKHVTHNEAIRVLDVIVQLSVTARNLSTPPTSPAHGDRYIVASAATDDWAGHVGDIALFENGAWQFFTPMSGWTAWVVSEQVLASYTGAAWVSQADGPFNVGQLGISATPDTTNRLSVSADATLLNHAGAGHQLKLNKAAAADTASLMFQTGFSGRAEMGTAGSDDFAIKVSADGTSFITGLSIASNTGAVTLPVAAILGGQPSDPAAPADGTIWLNTTTGHIKMQSGGASVVIAQGGDPLTDGDKGAITVGSAGTVWQLNAGAVGNAEMATMPSATFKARSAAGVGAPEDISPAEAANLLPLFDGASKGLVPASGGGTAAYLRADGTWAALAGGTSLADLGVTAAAAELNALDGITPAGAAIVQAGNAAAQRALLGLGGASAGLFLTGEAGNLARGAAEFTNTTFWPANHTVSGVTAILAATGVDAAGVRYADYAVSGTATAASFITLNVLTQSGNPTLAGQTRTASFFAQIISGTVPANINTGIRVDVLGLNATLAIIEHSIGVVQRPIVETLLTQSHTFIEAAITQSQCRVFIRTESGQTVNYTVRIKGLQFDAVAARANYRWVAAAPAQARAALGLGTATPFSNLALNGEERLPSGLVLKWGTMNTAAASSSVTFPIAFPNACFGAVINANSAAATSGAEYAHVTARSTTGLSFASYSNNGGQAVGEIFWMAMGW